MKKIMILSVVLIILGSFSVFGVESCIDSDGGLDSSVQGIVTDSSNQEFIDACEGTGYVQEWYCLNDLPNDQSLNCPSGTTCQDGACQTAKSACTDSDGGLDSSVQGIVTDASLNQEFIDACEGTGYVQEWYCLNDLPNDQSLNCPSGTTCQGGACVGCGNGVLEPGEQCDDSNLVSGDGCSNACMTELQTEQFTCAGYLPINSPQYDKTMLQSVSDAVSDANLSRLQKLASIVNAVKAWLAFQ